MPKWIGAYSGLVFLALTHTTKCEEPFLVGYAGSWSNPTGQPAEFHLSGKPNPAAELTIYNQDIKPVATVTAAMWPQSLAKDIVEPWKDGLGFDPTTINLPELQSGLYHLDGPELTSDGVPFIISDPDTIADIVVIYPTNTVNAYTLTNDVSLYSKVDGQHPEAVSFHRPMDTPPDTHIYMTRGLDRMLIDSDYSYKYIADSDLESFGAISGAKLVIIPGHSEYWTETARRNFDQFVDLGGSALVLSGNAMYRSVGYDDPESPTQMTFWPRRQFTNPRLEYPTWQSIGVDFEHGGNGSHYRGQRETIDHPYDGFKLVDVSPSYFDGLGLEVGDVINNPSPEYDGVPFIEIDPITGPVIDRELLGFHEIELIGFDNAVIGGQLTKTAGTWIDFLKTEDSGRVITVGAVTWTLLSGRHGHLKRKITENMIDVLLVQQADFDGDEALTEVDIELLFEQLNSESPRQRFDLTEDSIVDERDVTRWLNDFAGTAHGDANLDGVVGFRDYLALASNFEGENATWSEGDFNGDDVVSFADFQLLLTGYRYRESTDSSRAIAVPEPAAIWPCVLSVSLLIFRSRNRRSK